MNVDENIGGSSNYYSNSFEGAEPDETFNPPTIELDAQINKHTRPIENVDFFQTGELWRRVLSDEDKDHLVYNIVDHIGDAQERIQYRQCSLFYKAEPGYGTHIAEGLGLDMSKVKKLSEMTLEELY